MTTKVAGYIGKINPGDGKQHALGSTAYGYCETAAATAAKVVDMTGFTLVEGATIFVKFKERNNAANPTLNVNGTGAKPIYRYGTTRPGTNDNTNGWQAGAVMAFTYDGAGWLHHYWQNAQYNLGNNTLGSGNFTTNSAIYRYQMLFHTTREKLTPLNNNDNVTATTKTMLTGVDLDLSEKIYCYDSTTTVAANGSVNAGALYFTHGSGIDLRYTFNIETTTLTAHKDLYLKVSKQSNGLFRLASASPLTQTLPSSADGYYYCFLGRTSSGYQLALYEDHPIYYYDGGLKVLPDHNHDERYYTESEIDTKLNSIDSNHINLPYSSDLNALSAYSYIIASSNSNTLNTPYKEGVTDATVGVTYSHISDSCGVQVHLATGNNNVFIRTCWPNGSAISWSGWRTYGADTGWVAITHANVASGTFKYRKCDAVVTVLLRGVKLTSAVAANGSVTIGSLPSGVRPTDGALFFPAGDRGRWGSLQMEQGGNIVFQADSHGLATSEGIWGTATFIAGS